MSVSCHSFLKCANFEHFNGDCIFKVLHQNTGFYNLMYFWALKSILELIASTYKMIRNITKLC